MTYNKVFQIIYEQKSCQFCFTTYIFSLIQLLTLESLMRWGGVVDELEFATQLDQWRIHGFIDIDPVPGTIMSPLMMQVFIIKLKLNMKMV